MQSLRRLGVRERDVEDLCQDVFIAVHAKLGDYDPERPLKRWLFGFARRMASDHRRKAGYQREVLDDTLDPTDGQTAADEVLSESQRRRLLLASLDALDDKSREVFVMYFLDEVPASEIAAELGESDDAVTSRLRRASQAVTQEVQRLQKRGGPR